MSKKSYTDMMNYIEANFVEYTNLWIEICNELGTHKKGEVLPVMTIRLLIKQQRKEEANA